MQIEVAEGETYELGWEDLPTEVTQGILSFLRPFELTRIAHTSAEFYAIARDPRRLARDTLVAKAVKELRSGLETVRYFGAVEEAKLHIRIRARVLSLALSAEAETNLAKVDAFTRRAARFFVELGTQYVGILSLPVAFAWLRRADGVHVLSVTIGSAEAPFRLGLNFLNSLPFHVLRMEDPCTDIFLQCYLSLRILFATWAAALGKRLEAAETDALYLYYKDPDNKGFQFPAPLLISRRRRE